VHLGTVASIESRRPGPSSDARENWRRRAKELRATREKISREDERLPDKNSWVHYFGICQVKNAKHLEMYFFFSLAKRLGTWQTPTNGKLQQVTIETSKQLETESKKMFFFFVCVWNWEPFARLQIRAPRKLRWNCWAVQVIELGQSSWARGHWQALYTLWQKFFGGAGRLA